MQIFTLRSILKNKFGQFSVFLLLTLLFSFQAEAQRSYSLIYSENLKGGTTMFGNTLLHIEAKAIKKLPAFIDTLKMNDNSITGNSDYGNDGNNMVHIDIDGNTGPGTGTRNSSSSDLIMPTGSKIKFARLYWGGVINNADYDLSLEANKTVKLRKGNINAYTDIKALGIDKVEFSTGGFIKTNFTQYQAYADVTAFIEQNRDGTYTMGNAPLTTGAVSGIAGNHGGWTIVVVYESNNVPFNSVRIYDGFQKVYSGGAAHTTSVTLNGLNVPSGTMASADAKMGVMTWEGDANIKGDFLKINGALFSNSTNAIDNPWNGTITNNGVHVTTKNPNYTNNMGVDIDLFDVGTGYNINPHNNTVDLVFGTEADQYFPGLFTFSIKMKDPSLTLIKTVTDANGNNEAETGELLTYTLKGKNVGVGNANLIELIDTLPSTVTYVPNTLRVIHSPGITAGMKTDTGGDDIAEYISSNNFKVIKFRIGTGANATRGGSIAEGETYEVQFQVTVNAVAKGHDLPAILNIARISSKSDAEIMFTNDATAFLSPKAAPLPVSLMKFTASLLSSDKVKIDWSTSMEINNSHFFVERSMDGNFFSTVARVTGNGTTALLHAYSIMDDVANAGSIIYYRLQQVDLDGRSNFSNVIAIKIAKDNQIASVSPNPFSSYLNVQMDWSKSEVITARILNIQGKEVVTKKLQVVKGANQLRIDDLSKLPSGSYFIQFISATERITQKISK